MPFKAPENTRLKICTQNYIFYTTRLHLHEVRNCQLQKSPLYLILFSKRSLWNKTRKNITKSKPVPSSKTGQVKEFVQVAMTNMMFVMSQKATLMFRRGKLPTAASRQKSQRVPVIKHVSQQKQQHRGTWLVLTEPKITFYCISYRSIFCVFGCIDTNRSSERYRSCTNYPACRLLSRWVLPMREDRAAKRGAVTVSSASPQCCLFTLVAPDWVRVTGSEIVCMCVNTICFRGLQLAF